MNIHATVIERQYVLGTTLGHEDNGLSQTEKVSGNSQSSGMVDNK